MSEELEDIFGALFQIIYDYNNVFIKSSYTKQCILFLLKQQHQVPISVYEHHIVYNIDFILTEINNDHKEIRRYYLMSELKWLINLNLPNKIIQMYIKNPYFLKICITNNQIRDQYNLMKLTTYLSNKMGDDFANNFYNTWKY